jgi:hypothetical protein
MTNSQTHQARLDDGSAPRVRPGILAIPLMGFAMSASASCFLPELDSNSMPQRFAAFNLPEAVPFHDRGHEAETERKARIRSLRGKYRDSLPSTQEFVADKRTLGDRW